MRYAYIADKHAEVGREPRHHYFCHCVDHGDVGPGSNGLFAEYDALYSAYGGGFGRRHHWLVTATEKRVVGLIEIAA
jgi:hypothetical protein